ncbi:MAG: phosphatidylglycerophosphatase A [Bacilli bacterium]
MKNYKEKCIKLLEDRGVSIKDIAECSFYLQAPYHPNLKVEDFYKDISSVLDKTEVQSAIMVAIELDRQAENGTIIDKDLSEILHNDDGLFGTDEVIAYGICNLYGSIALTNFGYIDKKKIGIIGKLNDPNTHDDVCNTFLDDIVGAIASAAAGKYAHNVLENK